MVMNIGEEFRYLILALQREGNRQLVDALQPLNLTPSQAEVMLILHQYQPMTLIELGKRLICETGSPSRLIKTMVGMGLVEKRPNIHDKRAIQLYLTPMGTEMMPNLIQIDKQFNLGVGQLLDESKLNIIIPYLWEIADKTDGGQALFRRKNQL